MTFTDDDLKRLKEINEKFPALLARLEAAEDAMMALYSLADLERFPMLEDSLERWRKAVWK